MCERGAQGGRTSWIAFSCLLTWVSAAPNVLAAGATRSLADYAGPGVPFAVSISIDPPPNTMAMGVEDSPPPGWTDIGNITEGGTYDGENHKVKWALLSPPFPGKVAYDLTPPGATWKDCFVGSVSFNGGPDWPIEGDQCLPGPVPAISERALIVLAILVLTIGGFVVVKRRPTAV